MASASPLDKVACRPIIINNGKLFIVKHKPENDFYCLPWWSLERWETLQQCFEREIEVELGIKPLTAKLLFINEWLLHSRDKHILEFFYYVENSKDFIDIDISKASHNFELCEIKWIDINEDFPELQPRFLLPELRKINWNDLENHQVKIMLSE